MPANAYSLFGFRVTAFALPLTRLVGHTSSPARRHKGWATPAILPDAILNDIGLNQVTAQFGSDTRNRA